MVRTVVIAADTAVEGGGPPKTGWPSRFESSVHRWPWRAMGKVSPCRSELTVSPRYVTIGDEKSSRTSVFQSKLLFWKAVAIRMNSGSVWSQPAEAPWG